jgi:deoxyribodipyrimidine photolyase-related protein
MTSPRLSVWIPGDQLLNPHPAITAAEARTSRDQLHIVLVESVQRAQRLPYHRKKITLLFSAMRHYADTLRAAGYAVDYQQAPTIRDGLRAHVAQHQPERLITMAAADYRGRRWQQTRLADDLIIPVDVLPNTQFLLGQFDPQPDPEPGKRYVMEYFYRDMRRHFNVLMDGDDPAGGEWNFDKDNRKRLPAAITPPDPPLFPPDAITQAVIAEVDALPDGTGPTTGFALAVTHAQAAAALDDFIQHRLADFGPYEDAMTARHETLFHSVLSPYLNIGLITPVQAIRAAEAAYRAGRAPINSAEGFIRQILGWREFMYWQYWRLMPDILDQNAWGATRPLPEFFWSGVTEMRCLAHVLRRVEASGYAHHIERLMLLANFCTLAGIDPLAVNDWFLSAFIDAYDWVMIPNVLGMGLNADGGIIATKPYIASANYINKMSDYCTGCRFDRKQRTGPDACPFNFLYWHFLLTHEATLRANPRLGRAVFGLRHLDNAERAAVQAQAAVFLDTLSSGSS